ncbi:peptidoglycan-N-acetylglucosamine deacetylase [Holospora elegans E1]|uniref:Chitooligosaccharide deacetylase n=1 Tax=Holospora elegans E1 TaxID=1427503 RepID=A0A023DZ65_9PROT|nr:peptidoglycan-N-acetylglucosamine deacetylase [Holospora elegans E1]
MILCGRLFTFFQCDWFKKVVWKRCFIFFGIVCFGIFLGNGKVECSDSRVVSCKNFPDRTVLLTFDDGPSSATKEVLDALKNENASAIFFIVGEKANEKEGKKILKLIADSGHMIANHGYKHVTMTKLTEKEQISSLDKTNSCIKEFQKTVLYFRPPGGACNNILKRSVNSLGMKIMFWNVDPRDWKKNDCGARPSRSALKERILKGLEDQGHKGIVLLHDIHLNTALAVPMILDALKKNGYSFMKPEDVLKYQKASK